MVNLQMRSTLDQANYANHIGEIVTDVAVTSKAIGLVVSVVVLSDCLPKVSSCARLPKPNQTRPTQIPSQDPVSVSVKMNFIVKVMPTFARKH